LVLVQEKQTLLDNQTVGNLALNGALSTFGWIYDSFLPLENLHPTEIYANLLNCFGAVQKDLVLLANDSESGAVQRVLLY